MPKKFFGTVDAKRHVPRNNVLFVGGIALVGAFAASCAGRMQLRETLGAEMLNFGALIAFMGVNAAAFRALLRAERKRSLAFCVAACRWAS